MSINKKFIDLNAMIFKIDATGMTGGVSGGTGTYSYVATGDLEHVDTTVTTVETALIRIEASNSGTTVIYNGPNAPFGGYSTSTSFNPKVEVAFKDIKVYCVLLGQTYKFVCGSIDLIINDSVVQTFSGFTEDSTGTGPTYIPYIGTPFNFNSVVNGTLSATNTWSYDPCDVSLNLPFSANLTMSGGFIVGVRYIDRNNEEITLPIKIKDLGKSAGIVTGSNCNSVKVDAGYIINREQVYRRREYVEVEVSATCFDIVTEETKEIISRGPAKFGSLVCGIEEPVFWDIYFSKNNTQTKAGSVYLQPNVACLIDRLNGDFSALYSRNELPECRGVISEGTGNLQIPGAFETTTTNVTVYSYMSEFSGRAYDGVSDCEEPLTFETYAPYGEALFHRKREGEFYVCPALTLVPTYVIPRPECSPGSPPPGTNVEMLLPTFDAGIQLDTTLDIAFPNFVQSGISHPLWHNKSIIRYFGTWGNPFWAFGYQFEDWLTRDGLDYWQNQHRQYFGSSYLPVEQKTFNATHLAVGMLGPENQNEPFQQSFYNGRGFIGVKNFRLQEITIPTEVTFDDAHITTNDVLITPTVGVGGISVTGPVELYFDLISWDKKPYLLPSLAKEIVLDFVATDVEVYLEDAFGKSVLLGTTPGTYSVPYSTPIKYAGSWEFERGLGIYDDAGSDSLATGVSGDVMSDPQLNTIYNLSSGRSYKRLKFVINSGSLDLEWPIVKLFNTHPHMIWENGQTQVLYWANGPLIRLGDVSWYDSILGFQDPPFISNYNIPFTLIDLLAFKHRLFLGTGGVDLAATIAGELFPLYDAFETRAVSTCDQGSRAFLLPKGNDNVLRFAYCDSLAEQPPMSLFPTRLRNENWQQVGGYAQIVYDWGFTKLPILSDKPTSFKILGVDSGAFLPSIPDGYAVYEYETTFDATTLPTYDIVNNAGVKHADVIPYYGYTALGNTPKDSVEGYCINQAFTTNKQLMTVYINDDSEVIWLPKNVVVATDAKWADIICHGNFLMIEVLFNDDTRKQFYNEATVVDLTTRPGTKMFSITKTNQDEIIRARVTTESNQVPIDLNDSQIAVVEFLHNVLAVSLIYNNGQLILSALLDDQTTKDKHSYDKGLTWI